MKFLEVTSHHDTQIVSTADLKTHLRITFSDDDTYIAGLEKAAVHRIEEFTNTYLLETTLRQYGNRFSDLNILYKSPMKADSTTIDYRSSSAWVTLAAADYEVIHQIKPPRIYPAQDSTLPTTDDVFTAWRCSYTVGYAAASDIPDPIIQAIKIVVADMYENRQSVIVGKIVSEIPKTAQYLMNPYKIQTL
tara:strand:+ start:1837 stop:2409 length:573 start_codon:yes stop_codon:yes gene_type:complete